MDLLLATKKTCILNPYPLCVKLKHILLPCLLSMSSMADAQVIIVAIFGDQLNSGKIEFGLDGGYNASWLMGQQSAQTLNNFNLGFFFHVKLTEKSFISTGVHVKSNVGGSGMPAYPIGDPAFDAVYANGERTTKLSVFYVPIMWQQRFNQFFVEGGIQPGLVSRVNDIFTVDGYGGKQEYTRDVSDDYTRLDFGFVGGVGYRLKPGPVATSLGVDYYHGVVDIYKPQNLSITNSSLYVYFRIPIGAGEKNKNKK